MKFIGPIAQCSVGVAGCHLERIAHVQLDPALDAPRVTLEGEKRRVKSARRAARVLRDRRLLQESRWTTERLREILPSIRGESVSPLGSGSPASTATVGIRSMSSKKVEALFPCVAGCRGSAISSGTRIRLEEGPFSEPAVISDAEAVI